MAARQVGVSLATPGCTEPGARVRGRGPEAGPATCSSGHSRASTSSRGRRSYPCSPHRHVAACGKARRSRGQRPVLQEVGDLAEPSRWRQCLPMEGHLLPAPSRRGSPKALPTPLLGVGKGPLVRRMGVGSDAAGSLSCPWRPSQLPLKFRKWGGGREGVRAGLGCLWAAQCGRGLPSCPSGQQARALPAPSTAHTTLGGHPAVPRQAPFRLTPQPAA